jgi:hypothetical protein
MLRGSVDPILKIEAVEIGSMLKGSFRNNRAVSAKWSDGFYHKTGLLR